MWLPEESDEVNTLRKKFNYFRGQTVTIFAHAEFMIGELLLALQEDPRFEAKFQYKIEKKLRNFKNAFESNALLSPFQKDACQLVDLFKKAIDDRNDFAHGMASMDASTDTITMTNLKPKADDPWYRIIATYEICDLEKFVRHFAEIAESLMSLILNVDNSFELGVAPQYYGTGAVWVREAN